VNAARRLSCDEVRDLAPAYVLGALERDEEAAVRDHLADCPEAHAEVTELGAVVPYLADAVEQIEPSPSLRDRIMAAAAADPARAASAAPTPTAARTEAEPEAPPAVPQSMPIDRRRARRAWADASPATWLLRIAAVLVIGVLGAWNVLLQGQVSTLAEFRSAVATVADAAAQPGAVSAALAGSGPQSPRGVAAVRADGALIVAVSGLTATAGAEVYEAWLIAPGGTPVPVGSFTVGREGTGVLRATAAGAAPGATLALTREPAPGATKPTLPIVSSGVVRATT
jgi:anti-sigma-K factor RskA